MLGPALLVAPVFCADGTVEFYLPDRRVDVAAHRRDRRPERGLAPRRAHGFDSLPLYVRPGTALPVGGAQRIARTTTTTTGSAAARVPGRAPVTASVGRDRAGRHRPHLQR